MPRNTLGVYTLPGSVNPVVGTTPILAAWANTTMSDIAQALGDSLDRYGRGGMQAPLLAVDGLVSGPGLSFTNETSTGLYRAASGTVDLSVLGSRQVRFVQGQTTFGNTGSSGYYLELVANSNQPVGISFSGFGSSLTKGAIVQTATDQMDFWSAGAARMRLTTAGRLGLGLASGGGVLDPAAFLHLRSGSALEARLETTGDLSVNGASSILRYADSAGLVGYVGYGGVANRLDMWNTRAGPIVFGTSNAERMRIGADGTVTLDNGLGGGVLNAAVLAFSTGNVERVRIDGTGLVGIGTTSPASLLHVAGGLPFVDRVGAVGGGAVFRQSRGTLAAPTQSSAVDTAGIIAARAYDGAAFRDVGTITFVTEAAPTGTSSPGYIAFNTTPAGSTTATERARFDSSGLFLFSCTALSSGMPTAGGIAMESGQGNIKFRAGGSNTVAQFAHSSASTVVGSITVTAAVTSFNTTSDFRLKENIADAAPAGRLVDSIRVRKYDWKADGSHQRYGVIAQELEPVFPEAVTRPADPEQMLAVDYSKLVPLLVAEVQDLRRRMGVVEAMT